MKKVFLCALISLCGICFAQSVSQKAASRRTAERCLKLSENYFLAGDIDSALYQAELGLTYDDSVSDLYYMKAVCRNKLGAAVREVLEISETAREKKNWIGYNEKGNRILLSDLLSDTGKYEEALNELDRTPFVFSADAEAVRIKTYYREGSESSLSKARDKVNSARRIYKGDERFLNLFFNFEMSFCLLGGRNYIPPKKVLQMADVLSQEMKGMKEVSPQTESISLFFEGFLDSEKQLRGLKAFDAAEKSDYLFPLTCLKSGYWDEAKAFDEFFHFAEKSCTLDVLDYFYSLLESSEILDLFYRTMNAWNGLLYIDLDRDLQWEFDVQYERGRPTSVSYDRNHDGIIDLSCSLDFGELLSAKITPLGTEFFYSDYPCIGKAVKEVKVDPEKVEKVYFDFSKNAFSFSPLKFDVLYENENCTFYVPSLTSLWCDEANLDYFINATFIKTGLNEKENAFVTYSLLDGNVVSAVYSCDDEVYASCEFLDGIPSDRYVDSDNDGIYETHEIYEIFEEGNRLYFSENDFQIVKDVFPYFDFSEKVFLSEIQIDRDNDNNPEYREFFREKGGKTCVWIYPDGHTETFTRHPKTENSPLVEESVFVIGLEQKTVSVLMLDGKPSSVTIDGSSYKVLAGEYKDFYWIDAEGSGDAEVQAIRKLSEKDNGFIIPFETESGFYSAIKMADKIFARKLETSQIE